jgi:uncharacterized membrane protein YeaQ/YmgE (transglycosylase-associated protein family)
MLWAWIVWIVVGGIAGWLASLLVEGTGLGILWDVIVGIIGGFIGGIILGALGVVGSGIWWTFITAFVGAVILLFIVKLVTGGRTRARGRAL